MRYQLLLGIGFLSVSLGLNGVHARADVIKNLLPTAKPIKSVVYKSGRYDKEVFIFDKKDAPKVKELYEGLKDFKSENGDQVIFATFPYKQEKEIITPDQWTRLNKKNIAYEVDPSLDNVLKFSLYQEPQRSLLDAKDSMEKELGDLDLWNADVVYVRVRTKAS